MTETTWPFTRSEIAERVRGVFGGAEAVGRADVLEALRDSGAPSELIEYVGARIPERTNLRDMRALWVYLRDVPLEREAA